MTLDGTVSPEKLPRNLYVPVALNVFGRIATTDGAHPPALREAVVDIDKDVKVNARDYPVCRRSRFETREPDGGKGALEKVCGSSIIGRGRAQIEIAFPDQKPIKMKSPLVVFNGGEEGDKVTLLIHIFVTVPAPTAIVTTVTITREGGGIHAVARIPVVAGGSGSLLSFNFKLGRAYLYRDRRVGYLEARCPDSVFKVNFPEFLFRNETHTPGQEASFNLNGKLAVPCTPTG